MNSRRIVQVLAVALIAAIALFALKSGIFRGLPFVSSSMQGPVLDRAGVIPSGDLPQFKEYIGWIMRESGMDIRIVFVPDTGDKSIESLATDLMDELKVGGRTGQERGILLLYDMKGQRLRVEVGYGLEGWFPDSFVNYLVQDHARMFFSSGDVSLGLRLMLRLLQNRVREAVMGNDFDPRALDQVQALSHMSGGAGVSAAVGLGDRAGAAPQSTPFDPMSFPAGDSPTNAYFHYLEWLSRWPQSRQADLFTPGTRGFLASLPLTPAYAEFILLAEYGKRFKVVEHNDLALLYFTGTPFVSPHFFVRQGDRWRMDLVAEIRDTREHVGGEYTWAWRGEDDDYTRDFGDLLITVKGYRRFRDGDNRPLTIRGGN